MYFGGETGKVSETDRLIGSSAHHTNKLHAYKHISAHGEVCRSLDDLCVSIETCETW